MKSLYAKFQKSVNMQAREILGWAKNPASKQASFAATRARLPALAALKKKPASQWTARDEAFARRVINFNSRMEGMAKKWGCTTKLVTALRNWGRQPSFCPKPKR